MAPSGMPVLALVRFEAPNLIVLVGFSTAGSSTGALFTPTTFKSETQVVLVRAARPLPPLSSTLISNVRWFLIAVGAVPLLL